MTSPRVPLRDSYEGILNRARAAFQAQDVYTALGLYRRLVQKLGRLSGDILRRRPQLRDLHIQASLELVELLRFEGRHAEAIEVLEQLMQSHADDAHIWRREIAVLRNAKGETDRGLAELRSLAEERPDDAWSWLALGLESRIEGRFSESQAALERALEAASSIDEAEVLAEVHYQRFRLKAAMGQIDAALAAWEAALASHSDVGKTVREVYTLLADAGRYGEAQRYVTRDTNDLQAGFQRGLIASLTGDGRTASQQWQAVARLDPSEYDAGHDAWVEATLRSGNPELALEKLPVLLREHGGVRLSILSGIAWAMRGDRELAATWLQRAIDVLRRGRPPRKKLESGDWHLLDSLVSDSETKAALKPYFAVIDRVWDRPGVLQRIANR